ncbi:MAG: polyhydroxyalkanoate biosynthesis repressor PhaR [Lachnospiraceae bacterium]|nr:polyhydroxyalkanoate biosynthesis repressor PhaR [Lachnospiraceae bacterium]
MSCFKIKDIGVGDGYRPLVIPEIGINHGGSLEVAIQMVDAAKRAGARLVKHQTHVVEDEMSHLAKKVIPGNSKVSIYEVMEECALSEEEEKALFDYVESLGMAFISTPFSRAAAIRLEKFGVSAYKIGSGELNNYPLIEHIAGYGKPMIISTGMNDIEAIQKTVEIVERKNVPYALLHTTNLYPTKPEQVRLGAMQEMMEAFPNAVIGLSDHTCSNTACIAAMALGAKVVERHFTDHMERIGNDIVCSMDEQRLAELLIAANDVSLMLGGKKEALAEEQVTIDFAFATVVSTTNIKEGEMFTHDNIWVKRPGTGEIRAEEYETLIGKKATCDIQADTHITHEMVGV